MREKQTIVSVLNQKGGVGKTTSTINLASALGKLGSKVLVVDADPQGNATSGLGLDKNSLSTTLYDVLVSGVELSSVIQNTSSKNVFLVPSNSKLASAEIDISNKQNRELILKNHLHAIGRYDYILIDCPPSLGLLTINALSASNKVLIPVQSEYYALEGLSQLLQVMQQVQASYNPNLELLGVAITMYDKRNSLSKQVQEELKKHFGNKLMSTIIPRNIRLAEAPSYGKPIDEYEKWSKGAKAYKNLAKEIDKTLKGKKEF